MGIILTLSLAMFEDKSKRKYLHMFIVNRLFSIGSLISITILIGSALSGVFTHFTIILVTAGIVSMILSGFAWRRLKTNPPLQVPYFWVGVAFICGIFSIFAAYSLLPSITTMNGLITFIILVLLAVSFVIRVVVVAKPQIWVGLGTATFVASQTPSWLSPKTFFGIDIQFTSEFIWAIAIIAFIITIIVIWALLSIVIDGANIVNKALSSFPVLFVLGLMASIWGLGLGVFQWQL